MYKFDCGVCGRTFKEETKEKLVMQVKRHFKRDHDMIHEKDTEMAGMERDEDEIRKRIEEVG